MLSAASLLSALMVKLLKLNNIYCRVFRVQYIFIKPKYFYLLDYIYKKWWGYCHCLHPFICLSVCPLCYILLSCCMPFRGAQLTQYHTNAWPLPLWPTMWSSMVEVKKIWGFAMTNDSVILNLFSD